jgi:hypothetical protein
MDVTVIVRHRIGVNMWHRTRLDFPIPENIDIDNVDDFIAAMVEHTAAVHQEENFDQPERLLVDALRRQVLTGLVNDAEHGPGRRLALRIRRVLGLDDRQLLEQFSTPRQGGPNVG